MTGGGWSVGHTPSPPTTPSAASLSALAQAEEMLGFFPFAARIAFPSACLSAFFARLSNFRACFSELVAAWSMRLAALSNFFVTLRGTASPAHTGLLRPASRVQRGLVQGSVLVVVGPVVVVEVVIDVLVGS